MASARPDQSSESKGAQSEQGLTLLHKISETSMSAHVLSCNANMFACKMGGQWQQACTGRAERAGIGAAPQDARNWHDCQYDQPQCGHLAMRAGRNVGERLDVNHKICDPGMNANVISCNAAISACEKEGQLERPSQRTK